MDFKVLWQFAIIIFSGGVAWASVKFGLNGTRQTVKEHHLQITELIKCNSEHNTKIAVIETKLTAIEQGIKRIEDKLQS